MKLEQPYFDRTGPSNGQKLFVVLSAAVATVCFLTNAILVLIFVCRRLTTSSAKNTLFLSQAVAGLFTTVTIIYPVQLLSIESSDIMQDPYETHEDPGTNFFYDPTSCYLLGSGVLVLCLCVTITSNTLLLLDIFLKMTQPVRYITLVSSGGPGLLEGSSAGFWFATLTWVQACVIAFLPWAGWNRWGGYCYLPSCLSYGFMLTVTIVFFLHVAALLYMFGTIYHKYKAGTQPVIEEDECPIYESSPVVTPVRRHISNPGPSSRRPRPNGLRLQPVSDHSRWEQDLKAVKSRWLNFTVIVCTHLPMVVYLLIQSSRFTDAVMTQYTTKNDEVHFENAAFAAAENDGLLPWLGLLVVLGGAATSLVYIFSDEELSNATILVLRDSCCVTRGRQRNSIVTPIQETTYASTQGPQLQQH